MTDRTAPKIATTEAPPTVTRGEVFLQGEDGSEVSVRAMLEQTNAAVRRARARRLAAQLGRGLDDAADGRDRADAARTDQLDLVPRAR